ncbi:MAG: hypothetical protein HC880_07535 [Bacteroidia bacterium]|nr:hypothetical protein [Bacteroidia bacterium]
MLTTGLALAQTYQVIGVVTDADNTPLPGVNVSLKGTTTGTVTDIDGRFSLSVSGQTPVIVVSFMGYKAQEIPHYG